MKIGTYEWHCTGVRVTETGERSKTGEYLLITRPHAFENRDVIGRISVRHPKFKPARFVKRR